MSTFTTPSFLLQACATFGFQFDELILLNSLYTNTAYVDLDDVDFAVAAANAVNAQRPRGLAIPPVDASSVLSLIDQTRLVRSTLFNRSAYNETQHAATAAFADADCAASAQPSLDTCVRCGAQLERAGHTTAWFYADGAEVVKGRLYSKQCTRCNCLYELDGYTFQGDLPPAGCSKPPKHPYAEHQGGRWDRVSNDTVIEVLCYRRFEGEFVYMQAGPNAAANAHNHTLGIGA